MFCTRCGRAVPDGARFCPNCGAAVTLVTAPGAETWGVSPAPTPTTSPYAPPGGGATPAPEPPAPAPAAGAAVAWPVAGMLSGAAFVPLPQPVVSYGGFWRRWVAAVIDSILLNILLSPVYFAWVFPAIVASSQASRPEDMDPSQAFAVLGTLLTFVLIGSVLEFAYYAWLESSSYQASLGKLAMGLKVTDLDGNRISFARALLRRIARILTGFTLLIGFLMVLWTRRRQTLHDLMVGTLVLRR